MKKNLYIILFFITGIVPTGIAQQNNFEAGSPEWLVDMFFNQPQFPGKENYFVGEMLQDVKNQTIGEELNGAGTVIINEVESDNKLSVYRINIGGNGNTANFYCYLTNVNGVWKIEAIRKFQVPAFIYDVVDSLSQLSSLPDSLSSLLKSLQLVVGPDDDLQTYFTENINSFYNLVGAFQNKATDKLNELMNSLYLDYIFTDEKFPNCIFILVSELGSMEVGYIYAANKKDLPGISPGRFIYVEGVLPNWYVFRAM